MDQHTLKNRLGGLIPALITPFGPDGGIDGPILEALVDRLIAQGAGGFYVGGSTGEAFLLTREERKRLADIVVPAVAGRVPVIFHVGSISTNEAIELARHGESVGVNAASAISPFYYKFRIDQIKQYYRDIADATELPFLIYNFPALSGFALDADTAGDLFAHPRIVGIKHTSMDLYLLERLKAAHPDMLILNGHDEVYLSALVMGADGSVGSTFNVILPLFADLRRAYEAGDLARALELQGRANSIIKLLLEIGVFPGIKATLGMLGLDAGKCRRPFTPPNREQLTRLEIALAEAEVTGISH